MGRTVRPRSTNRRQIFFICQKRRNKKICRRLNEQTSEGEINSSVQSSASTSTLVDLELEQSSSIQQVLSSAVSHFQSDSDPGDPSTSQKSKYKEKKEKRIENWKVIFPKILQIGTSVQFSLASSTCNRCHQPGANYRCSDCSPTSVFCRTCLEQQHSFAHLHKFEKFQNGTFMSIEIETPTWTRPDNHTCPSTYRQDILILDEKGRRHKRSVCFCSCETKAETMMRQYLWPSSPKDPSLGFHFKLLELMTALLLECQVSTLGFCEALQAVSSNHPKGEVDSQTINIYGILMNECLVQFRQYNYLISHPTHINPTIESGMDCPACYENPQMVVSFDADFQLVRKASSGTSSGKPKHGDSFFVDQAEVDTFMNNYHCTKNVTKDMLQDCSDFQAGSLLRSKGKNQKLDETAVFGSTCRHEFPLHFFNLKHGERIGYSVFLLEKIISENPGKQIHIMYDIACRLYSHLKACGRKDLLDAVTLVIPIFHCYAHKLSCQVLFNPRRTPGMGLSDGECVERLWSYLGKLSSISKEMTPENRIDILVLALIHYGEKITRKLAQHLSSKLQRAENLHNTTSKVLNETLENLPGLTLEEIEKFSKDETKTYSSKQKSYELSSFTPKETYSMNLRKFYSLSQTMMITEDVVLKEDTKKQIKRTETELLKFERQLSSPRWSVTSDDYKTSIQSSNKKTYAAKYEKIKMLMIERTFFLQMMKRYARGQAVSLRLGSQLKKINNRAKLEIKEYNSCCEIKDQPYPHQITFEEIKDQTFDGNSKMSNETKRLLIDLLETKKRCTEEIEMVTTEMRCTLLYYQYHHQQLCNAFNELDVTKEVEKSVLISEGLAIEYRIQQMMALYPSGINQIITGQVSFFHDIVKVSTSIQQDTEISNILSDISNEISLDDFENEEEIGDEDQAL